MAGLAQDSEAVVVGSNNGTHFANEVLSWHRVANLDADRVLPGLLITKTHPAYFTDEQSFPSASVKPDLEDLLVIPLRDFCTDETDFLRSIEGIFEDLRKGTERKNFDVARHDPRRKTLGQRSQHIVGAIELKPGMFGIAVDLKKLLSPGSAT